jgi:type VI secretion system secreted protein Hcp
MAEMFLELKDVNGETLDAEFSSKNAIEIQQWSWKASNNVRWDINQGGQATKASIEWIELQKWCDKASPTLHQCCITGKHIKSGKITCRKKDGDAKFTYMVLDLTDIMVNHFRWEGNGDEQSLREVVQLSFAEYNISYKLQADSGNPQGSSDFGFNIQKQAGGGGQG